LYFYWEPNITDKTDKKRNARRRYAVFKDCVILLVPSVSFGVIGLVLKGVQSEMIINSSVFGSDSTGCFICMYTNYIFLWKFILKAKVEDKTTNQPLLSILQCDFIWQ
jgi:POT family proton-dependent oligopeptide transporter